MADLVLTNTIHGSRLQVQGTSASLADLYLWLHHESNYNNPATMGPVDSQGWDPQWDQSCRGPLWYFDTHNEFGGNWELRWRKVLEVANETRWEVRWGFAIDIVADWYGFTAILDLNSAFSNRWHDGNRFATASGGPWPDTCIPPDPTANGRGEHIAGFSWVELSDGQTKFQRGPVTFPLEWHHPSVVETSADLLVDSNCIRTIELGWFAGSFRLHRNLNPVQSPLYWQGTELLRVGQW
jgi:hypothetical protein